MCRILRRGLWLGYSADTDFDAVFGGPGLAVFSRSLAAVLLSFTIASGQIALHAQDEKKDDAKAEHKDEESRRPFRRSRP